MYAGELRGSRRRLEGLRQVFNFVEMMMWGQGVAASLQLGLEWMGNTSACEAALVCAISRFPALHGRGIAQWYDCPVGFR